MNLNFDKTSRKEVIKDILADFKTKIDAEDNEIFASYESMDYLKNGFGFKFKIYASKNKNASDIDVFYQIKDYLTNMFGFIFNGKINVGSWIDDNNYEVEFEIVSEI